MIKSRIFNPNELIEIRNALKRERMLTVDRVAVYNVPDFDGHVFTMLYFVTKTMSKKITIRSKNVYPEVEAAAQLRKHFAKRSVI